MKKSRLVIICTCLVMMLFIGSMPLSAIDELDNDVISTIQDSGHVDDETVVTSDLDAELTESFEEEAEVDEGDETFKREETLSDNSTGTQALKISESGALFADINNINTVDELQTAVASAVDGDILTLSKSFTADSTTITIDNKTIIIDGNHITWNKGGITLAGIGTLTLKNMTIVGTNTVTRLLTVGLSAGTVTLDSMNLLNGKNGALDIKSSAATLVVINNSRISDNTSGTGPAIFMAGASRVQLNDSSIENNMGTAAGYEAGAIASKNFSGVLDINNSLLANNINKAANSGVLGGGGGAVSIHYFTGTFNIKDSIFKGNKTNGDDGSRASTYDGGAIYLFNMRNTAHFSVEGTSFIENVAYDDGGAILIQTEGSGNGDVVDKISFKNNTFFGNKAYGVDVGAYSGGAIQIFANVGFTGELHTKANFVGNTFVNNTVGGITDSASSLSGSALGLSMSSMKSTMRITLENNIFAANYVLDKNGNTLATNKSIYPLSRIENADYKTSNLGSDTTSLDQEYKEIFGLFPVSLSNNYSSVTAGVDKHVIPTLTLKPEGLAENKALSRRPGFDQRQFERYKDIGAIETTWLQYDANGGSFGLETPTQYDGQIYYESNENNVITNVYSVGFVGYKDAIKSDTNLKLSRVGHDFLGWADSANALVANPLYDSSHSLTHQDENKVVFAVWKEVKTRYIVKYTDGIDELAFSDQMYEVEEGEATPSFSESPIRDGYAFIGWSPEVSKTVNADVTYVAQWEKVVEPVETYTITYTDGSNDELYFKDVSYTALKDTETPFFSGNLIRDGYTFAGWNPDFSGFVTENVTYVAVWEKNEEPLQKYLVRYTDGTNNQAYFNDEEYSVKKGSDTPLFLGSLNRDGYTFTGWNPEFSDVVNGDVTYVAIWKKTEVMIPVEPIQPDKPTEVLPSTGMDNGSEGLWFMALGMLFLVAGNGQNTSKRRLNNR